MSSDNDRRPANARQVGGSHYKGVSASGREHWDVVAEFDLDYFQGQITKYVMRWRKKGGIGDLEKARHFLDKYIEVETAKTLKGDYTDSPAMQRIIAQADGEHQWDDPAVAAGDRSGS